MTTHNEQSSTPNATAARVALHSGQPTKYQVLTGPILPNRLPGWQPPQSDADLLAAGLRACGADVLAVNATLALRYTVAATDVTVVSGLPRVRNGDLAKFFAGINEPKPGQPPHRIIWKPATAQLDMVAEFGGRCEVVAMCLTKAAVLTGCHAPGQAARRLAELLGGRVTVVVTSPEVAAAARGREFAEVVSFRDRHDAGIYGEGRGAVLLAAFLAASERGASLTAALATGHTAAWQYVKCLRSGHRPVAFPTYDRLAALRETLELAQPRPVGLPRRLARAAAAVFAMW